VRVHHGGDVGTLAQDHEVHVQLRRGAVAAAHVPAGQVHFDQIVGREVTLRAPQGDRKSATDTEAGISLIQSYLRPSAAEAGCLLEGMGDLQDAEIVAKPADDLDSHGQPIVGKSGRHRYRRMERR